MSQSLQHTIIKIDFFISSLSHASCEYNPLSSISFTFILFKIQNHNLEFRRQDKKRQQNSNSVQQMCREVLTYSWKRWKMIKEKISGLNLCRNDKLEIEARGKWFFFFRSFHFMFRVTSSRECHKRSKTVRKRFYDRKMWQGRHSARFLQKDNETAICNWILVI